MRTIAGGDHHRVLVERERVGPALSDGSARRSAELPAAGRRGMTRARLEPVSSPDFEPIDGCSTTPSARSRSTTSGTSGPAASAPREDRRSSPARSCSASVMAPHSPTCWEASALARHSGTFGFPELNLLASTKGTSAGLAFGGGVAVRAGTRFEVGPEARFLILSADTDSGPAFANWIGGRFAFRF